MQYYVYVVMILAGFLVGMILGEKVGLQMAIDMLKASLGEQFEFVNEEEEDG